MLDFKCSKATATGKRDLNIMLKEILLRVIVNNKPPRTKASRVLDVLADTDFDRCTRLTGNDCIECCEALFTGMKIKRCVSSCV